MEAFVASKSSRVKRLIFPSTISLPNKGLTSPLPSTVMCSAQTIFWFLFAKEKGIFLKFFVFFASSLTH